MWIEPPGNSKRCQNGLAQNDRSAFSTGIPAVWWILPSMLSLAIPTGTSGTEEIYAQQSQPTQDQASGKSPGNR